MASKKTGGGGKARDAVSVHERFVEALAAPEPDLFVLVVDDLAADPMAHAEFWAGLPSSDGRPPSPERRFTTRFGGRQITWPAQLAAHPAVTSFRHLLRLHGAAEIREHWQHRNVVHSRGVLRTFLRGVDAGGWVYLARARPGGNGARPEASATTKWVPASTLKDKGCRSLRDESRVRQRCEDWDVPTMRPLCKGGQPHPRRLLVDKEAFERARANVDAAAKRGMAELLDRLPHPRG